MEKLDKATQKRIREKLKKFSYDPLRHARKLVNFQIGSYRLRIGDYRVMFDIDDDKIIILRVGH